MKNILGILIMIGVFGMVSCSSGKQYIEGTICKIGNEPFTNMAIQVDAYTVYAITANKEILDELEKQQGYKMKIFYSKIDSSGETKRVVLKAHEIINQE
jgi:starvation-inducible outer membrane lipoprotein